MKKTIKLKTYGKNKREMKKILSHESTRVTQDGKDMKWLLESLLGYEYLFKKIGKKLEITDILGDTWEITTELEFEVVA